MTFNYETAITTLQGAVEAITDDGTAIFSNVTIGKPSNISLYNGPLAVLLFSAKSNNKTRGVHGQAKKAVIEGVLVSFIPGDSEDSVLQCLRYSQLVEDWMDTQPDLEARPEETHNWRTINVSDVLTRPLNCTAAATRFVLTINKT